MPGMIGQTAEAEVVAHATINLIKLPEISMSILSYY